MKIQNSIVFIVVFFIQSFLFGGFSAGTLVKSGDQYVPIELLRVGDVVACYDFIEGYTEKPITHIVSCTSSKCALVVVNKKQIITSSEQQFYSINQHIWKKAIELKDGDFLLGAFDEKIAIEDVFILDQPIDLFDIAVKDYHNFLILHDNVLVHNFAPVVVGLSWFFGSGALQFTGASLGLAALGGLIGLKLNKSKQRYSYEINCDQKGTNGGGAQAPGKPTKEDGFVPPKKGDGKKVKNPNGPGYGWKDEGGNVWVPSGPNGHGGPHWDVQRPGGGYDNVVPGGKIRGEK